MAGPHPPAIADRWMSREGNVTTERQPTARHIRALLAFLPKLYADGEPPVLRWAAGAKTGDGTLVTPWPEYRQTVQDFMDLIDAQGCWLDGDYVPEEAERLLRDEAGVGGATIRDIQSMLTLVVRGERFRDGWWASMIEDGHVRRLLERLADIEREGLTAGE